MSSSVGFSPFPSAALHNRTTQPEPSTDKVSACFTKQVGIHGWQALSLEQVAMICAYVSPAESGALGRAHSYLASFILGRGRNVALSTIEAPGAYHPWFLPTTCTFYRERRNSLQTPLLPPQYHQLVEVHRRFSQPLESLKIRYLDLSSADMNDAMLQQSLRVFPNLVTLRLRDNPKITNLAPLADCSCLQYLDLGECKGLKGLQPLEGLAGLRSLALDDCTQVTDLTPLAKLTRLERLCLSKTGVTCLRPLAKLFFLQSLDCRGCLQIRPREWMHLQRLRLLKFLTIDAPVTDEVMVIFSRFLLLKRLVLSDCSQVTDEGFAWLEDLVRLRCLTLKRAVQLTDEGLGCIGQVRSLHDLAIFDSDHITDAGLFMLAGLPVLEDLTLRHNRRLSKAGLDQLRALDMLRLHN